MTGITDAALALSLAVMVLPAWPGRRLKPASASGGRASGGRASGSRASGGAVVCCGAATVLVVLPLTTAVTVVVLGVTTILRYRRHSRSRRAADESRALETALDVLVGELRVGAHPVRAFTVAADESGQTAVAESLRAVAARARLGADVSAGLRSVSGSSSLSTQWDRLAVCWQLATEHGLAISTLMRTAQRDVVERQRFAARVHSGTAGARATAAILTGLPVLGVLLGQLIGAEPVGFLLGGHTGGWLLVLGVMLTCGGLLWSDRITDRLVS